jgi:hypothetical protein
MKNSHKILLAFLLFALADTIWYITPLAYVILNPFNIAFLTLFILSLHIQMVLRICCIIVAIALNDFFVKLVMLGEHNDPFSLINLSLIFGIGVSIIMILGKTILLQHTAAVKKLILVFIAPFFLSWYVFYFWNLGQAYVLNPVTSKQLALDKEIFLFDLNFSERDIVFGKDSDHIVSGWAERELMLNHRSIICRIEHTGRVNYVVKIKHNFKKHEVPIYFKVNSLDVNGAEPVDSLLVFTQKNAEPLSLTFFDLSNNDVRNSRQFKTIKISH